MEARRTTVRDVRRSNRSVILTRIFRDGPLSRQDLGRHTALSAGSVSNLVGELLVEGVVEEAGSVDSDGGRPRVLLRVAPGYRYVAGAEVGETRVRVELFDLAMRPVAKVESPIETAGVRPAAVVRQVLRGLAQVTEQAGVAPDRIRGLGVAVAGVVDADGVVHAQTLGWDGAPLAEMLRARTDVPVLVDNGANALGQAEMWYGAGRGAEHAVIALLGSGVGAALVANGSSYRGARNGAGEWGHTTIAYGGRRCRCGATGCLEAYVGAESVLDRFRQANRGRPAAGADDESRFAGLLAGGSRTAAKVIDETIGYLGAGLANLVNLVNPDRIVLGGWAGLALGAGHLERIRAATAEHALREPFGQTSIVLCELGTDAVAMGAATLPLGRLLHDGG
jgi:predicted NBD/HSP70 family sugar kinase